MFFSLSFVACLFSTLNVLSRLAELCAIETDCVLQTSMCQLSACSRSAMRFAAKLVRRARRRTAQTKGCRMRSLHERNQNRQRQLDSARSERKRTLPPLFGTNFAETNGAAQTSSC